MLLRSVRPWGPLSAILAGCGGRQCLGPANSYRKGICQRCYIRAVHRHVLPLQDVHEDEIALQHPTLVCKARRPITIVHVEHAQGMLQSQQRAQSTVESGDRA